MSDYRQQQENEELLRDTKAALLEAFPHISIDSFKLLCWQCGVDPYFVLEYKSQLIKEAA